MPDPRAALPNGLVAAGGDLEPGTVLAAYRAGIFPWPDAAGRLLWWSPEPRSVLPIGGFHSSRRLRRTLRRRRFTITFDTACAEVMTGCADRAEGTWITPAMRAAYLELHRLGWVHSVEAWADGHLAGGLYGVAIGGLFAAESMFHRESDGSKAALAALDRHLAERAFHLLDVQFLTPHLATLGAIEITRDDYLHGVRAAIASPAGF